MIADEQVLICPDCQRGHDWVADLDTCESCGSTMLVRALGETHCRVCSWTKVAVPRPAARSEDLAEEVAAALERVLRRGGAT